MDTFTLTEALSKYIVGQKRTSKNKQFVFINNNIAIKGPYQKGRLQNVMIRSKIFTQWNTPIVVRMIDMFSCQDGTYIRFPNIMSEYKLESEYYTESFSNYSYNILIHPPVINLKNAIENKILCNDLLEDVILALCHCNILSVGDMNLRNTLIDTQKKKFYIIDFDDTLGTDRDDEVFYFNKKPSKKLLWYDTVKKYYIKVADRLRSLLNDEIIIHNNLVTRVERCITLLKKFGNIDTKTSPENITKVVSVRVSDIRPKYNDLKKWCEDPNNIYIARKGIVIIDNMRYPPNDSIWANPFKIDIDGTREEVIAKYRVYIKDKLNTGEISHVELEKLRGKILGCWCKENGADIACHGDVLVELLNGGVNIGKMVWKGLRGGISKTYSGIDFDVAKSALQKYTRRGITEKAILVAVELYRLSEIGGSAGVTNMYNRVAIMAAEDIGPANLPLTLEIIRNIESGTHDIYKLLAMIQLMCESSKTRMMSHCWRVYATLEGRATAIKMGLQIDTCFTEKDIEYIAKNKNDPIFNNNDPEQLRYHILIFMKRLLDQDFNAYSWAYFYLEICVNIHINKRKKFINGNTRSTTGKADILLWKVLSRIIVPEIHDILVEAYYNHTENRPFLQLAILIALYKLSYQKFDIEQYANIWKNSPVVDQMMNGNFQLIIDDFVIDKHTEAGRKQGKTIQDFVIEGSVVIPQSKEFYNAKLEEIYKIR